LVLIEQTRAIEFTKEAYVTSLSLKTIRVWRHLESEVKKMELVKVGYLKTQVCSRNIILEQRLFQWN